jgi:hypothetical protein
VCPGCVARSEPASCPFRTRRGTQWRVPRESNVTFIPSRAMNVTLLSRAYPAMRPEKVTLVLHFPVAGSGAPGVWQLTATLSGCPGLKVTGAIVCRS